MEIYPYDNIKRYVFPYIDSNMYVLVENEKALVIDPHISHEADAYLEENQVKDVTILLTHEHFDHICGIPWFQEHYGAKVVCQEKALNSKWREYFSSSMTVSVILTEHGEEDKIKKLEEEYAPHMLTAKEVDKTFSDHFELLWNGHRIRMQSAPGHSEGGTLIFLDELVFSGDNLVNGAGVICRMPGGSWKEYCGITRPLLEALPDDMWVLPGHGEPEQFVRLKKYMQKFGHVQNEGIAEGE